MEFLNNPIFIILVIVLAAVLVFGGAYLLIPYLIRRGVDVSGILRKADMGVDAMYTITETLQKLLPNSAALDIADRVLTYANKAVESAEQLYLTSQIPAEKRKEEATLLVYQFLSNAGVETTEALKPIVDGAIEAAVFALPKTHPGAENPKDSKNG